jgi:hypothetical protein
LYLASFKFIVSLPIAALFERRARLVSFFSESGRTLDRFGSIIESRFAAAKRDAAALLFFSRPFFAGGGGATRRFGAIPFIISNFSRVDNSRDAKNIHFCDVFAHLATSFSVSFYPF